MADTIESVLQEDRLFPPNAEFKGRAHLREMVDYERMYQHSIEDPEGFWGERARELIPWMRPFTKVLEWKEPFAKWFYDGATNASVVCLDRHLDTARRNKAAIIWEGEPGEVRTLTYAQLHREVCQLANALTSLGVTKGDRVAIYLPMIPEAA